jgi:ATP-dependent DNA ligase
MARRCKLRHRSHDPEVFLVAFDLLELDGNDLRREPLEVRKQTLASLFAQFSARGAVQRSSYTNPHNE